MCVMSADYSLESKAANCYTCLISFENPSVFYFSQALKCVCMNDAVLCYQKFIILKKRKVFYVVIACKNAYCKVMEQ